MRKRLFTILELLIVISIIVILTSLLLPALKTAKETANQTACLSNLKQQVFALDMITSDSNEYLPYSSLSDAFKVSAENKYGWQGWFSHCSVLYNSGYIKTLEVFFCPSSTGEPRVADRTSAELTSGREGQALRSYMCNRGFMDQSRWTTPYAPLIKRPSIAKPAQKMIFMDGYGYTSGTSEVGTVCGGANAWGIIYGGWEWNQSPGGRPSLRHRKKCNTVFIDGHAETRNDTWTNSSLWLNN